MQEKISKKKVIIILTSFAVVLAVLLFIIRPAVTGYAIQQQSKGQNGTVAESATAATEKLIQKLQTQLLATDANLSVYKTVNDKILTRYQTCSNDHADCKSELSALKTTHRFLQETWEATVKRLESEIEENEKELEKRQAQYDLIVRNTANNLCCKARIDNYNIKHYSVQNNKVVCLEEGVLNITCS